MVEIYKNLNLIPQMHFARRYEPSEKHKTNSFNK